MPDAALPEVAGPALAGHPRAFADRMDPKITLRKKPSAYLRQLYFDSVVMTTEGLRHLVAEVGADRIMMGSDHPAGWTTEQVDHILNTPGLSDADRAAMLGETAARLLQLAPCAADR